MLELRNFEIEAPIRLKSAPLALSAGKSYALIGPSGAGKSTFFQTIAGFQSQFSGDILWNAQRLNDLAPSQRPISYLFQRHNLFTHLSLRQNIGLGMRADLKLSEHEWREVDELMEELHIKNQASLLPRALSGGQSARGATARVILQKRDIVLFDEPFSALGPAQTQEIRELVMSRLKTQNRILIFVSHQLENISHWADEILWLDEGKIEAPKPANQFFVNASNRVKRYFGEQNERFL